MPEPPQTSQDLRRQQLIERIIDRIGALSLHDMSLRAIAQVIGTSHRMLIYYFGSKAQLVAELRSAVDARMDLGTPPTDWQAAGIDPISMLDFLPAATFDDPDTMRVGTQLLALALLDPKQYGQAEKERLLGLVSFVEQLGTSAGLDTNRAQAIATVVIAAIRGLQLDYITTGHRERVGAAIDELKGLLRLLAEAGLGISLPTPDLDTQEGRATAPHRPASRLR